MRLSKIGNQEGGAYSPYVVSKGMMYISGQLPIRDGEDTAVPGGIGPQTRQVLEQVERLLAMEGLGRDSVVMCRAYLEDVSMWAEFNRVYAEFFRGHKPARIAVAVGPMDFGACIELEAIAELPD